MSKARENKLAKRNASLSKQLATARGGGKMRRQKLMGRGAQFGGAYGGGAIFGENVEVPAALGIVGIVLDAFSRKKRYAADAMIGMGMGAAYMQGHKKPPKFLQDLSSSIKSKIDKAKADL